jgi:hypothetical protein
MCSHGRGDTVRARSSLMDSIARSDQEFGSDARKLSCGGEHQLGYAVPVSDIDRSYVVAEGA